VTNLKVIPELVHVIKAKRATSDRALESKSASHPAKPTKSSCPVKVGERLVIRKLDIVPCLHDILGKILVIIVLEAEHFYSLPYMYWLARTRVLFVLIMVFVLDNALLWHYSLPCEAIPGALRDL
jgi:hypothetical protein